MSLNLFKFKKPSGAKGKTIKKAEPTNGGRTSKDMRAEDSARVESAIDLLSIADWLKENAVKGPQPAAKKEEAGLWELKGPRRATIVPRRTNQLNAVSATGSKGERDSKETETKPAVESNDAEEPERPMFDLLIGHQDTSSQYFTRTYFRVAASSVPDIDPALHSSDLLHELPELNPNAFRLYQIWLHTGAILPGYHGAYVPLHKSTSNHKWQLFWPLLNAHILGCAIGAFDFADQVIDFLLEKLGTTQADDETIKHLFSADHKDVSKSLKCFVIDQCINANVAGSTELDLLGLPHAFAQLMAKRALLRLSRQTPKAIEAGCEYHMHPVPDACYKKKILPKDTRKQQWLEVELEKSRKDYEEVMKSSKANGIRTVDWEHQRAGVNRVSTMQAGGPGVPPTTQMQANRLSDPLTDAFFGTTQPLGAIDDVLTKVPAPTHKAPSPPPSAPTELPASITHSSDTMKAAPKGKATATELDAAVFKPVTSTGNNSPVSSTHSTQSNADVELRQNLEMALEFEKQNRCPGTFPVSRNGSTKSIAT
ncbi:hypothetical protein HBI56_128940 [Parastagonospora nodorum]|uniref:Uncharacterized protein n=2 Tax=Phaeosphaeria nodorum (strain SN15 / ATCC MYA-4574 / FGSC 10173) TaxID=321614 RepID=A0A7U2F021_PHANO|nr:hypothetical protein SNOG_05540 [Parastagonospora nodorum SN15]KAH3909987.1 hypothetical protein HBH56_154940 [Parastagonospora nodorum]EAT86604.1 hypothetical protein SNOG_05540 [Parastagonospora nodorum SN15]KAH3926609.1 hypothetical protein HBH54_162750 [Parastagonospora nodorum]KAH4047720.1 hypothetical protein HBH49_168890 [Parastagonospora nodorum]KAH4063859.1 hypothetical protein HBH50_187680 [Parastagonospora nodorum]